MAHLNARNNDYLEEVDKGVLLPVLLTLHQTEKNSIGIDGVFSE